MEGIADCPELELFEGTLPVDEEFKKSTKLVGVWKGEEYSHFTSGKIHLTEGRYIMPQDMESIIAKVKELKDVDWKGFEIHPEQ